MSMLSIVMGKHLRGAVCRHMLPFPSSLACRQQEDGARDDAAGCCRILHKPMSAYSSALDAVRSLPLDPVFILQEAFCAVLGLSPSKHWVIFGTAAPAQFATGG